MTEPLRKPRALSSVVPCIYRDEIDVVESELEVVVALLGIADDQARMNARDRIYRQLEDFKTAQSHAVFAKSTRKDVRDLKRIQKLMVPGWMWTRLRDAFEALEKENLVLHRRLMTDLRRHKLRDQLTSSPKSEEASIALAQEVSTRILDLISVIEEETSRPVTN